MDSYIIRRSFWTLWAAIIILIMYTISNHRQINRLETEVKNFKDDMELLIQENRALCEGDYEIYASDHENE